MRSKAGTDSRRLEAEVRLFGERRSGWIEDGKDGWWAVVHANTVLGLFRTLGEAFASGKAKWTPGTFLVKRVTPKDRVHVVQQAYWSERE